MMRFGAAARWTAGWLLLVGTLSVAWLASAQQARDGGGDQILLHSFASGQKFYIQKDSFQPMGNGLMQYTVTSTPGPDGVRVSRNEMDCRTGQMKSPIQSWSDSGNGSQQANPTDGPSAVTTLTNRTKLYDQMKDACRQAMPNLPMNW
jgi:hypothetical protein